MSRGVDYAWGRPTEAQLKAAGATFVARYASTMDLTKTFTHAEVAGHLAAGIAVVVVFEDGAQSILRGHSGGIADALAADGQARAAGMTGVPIYFACDFDATPAQQTLINRYLDGAASVIGKARTGLYGGFWPLSRARSAGKATWFWGTPAWSGDNWATCGWKPHIMQGAQVTIGGVGCDWDYANAADFGQWPRPPAPAPARPAGSFTVTALPPGVWKAGTGLRLEGTGTDGKPWGTVTRDGKTWTKPAAG